VNAEAYNSLAVQREETEHRTPTKPISPRFATVSRSQLKADLEHRAEAEQTSEAKNNFKALAFNKKIMSQTS